MEENGMIGGASDGAQTANFGNILVALNTQKFYLRLLLEGQSKPYAFIFSLRDNQVVNDLGLVDSAVVRGIFANTISKIHMDSIRKGVSSKSFVQFEGFLYPLPEDTPAESIELSSGDEQEATLIMETDGVGNPTIKVTVGASLSSTPTPAFFARAGPGLVDSATGYDDIVQSLDDMRETATPNQDLIQQYDTLAATFPEDQRKIVREKIEKLGGIPRAIYNADRRQRTTQPRPEVVQSQSEEKLEEPDKEPQGDLTNAAVSLLAQKLRRTYNIPEQTLQKILPTLRNLAQQYEVEGDNVDSLARNIFETDAFKEIVADLPRPSSSATQPSFTQPSFTQPRLDTSSLYDLFVKDLQENNKSIPETNRASLEDLLNDLDAQFTLTPDQRINIGRRLATAYMNDSVGQKGAFSRAYDNVFDELDNQPQTIMVGGASLPSGTYAAKSVIVNVSRGTDIADFSEPVLVITKVSPGRANIQTFSGSVKETENAYGYLTTGKTLLLRLLDLQANPKYVPPKSSGQGVLGFIMSLFGNPMFRTSMPFLLYWFGPSFFQFLSARVPTIPTDMLQQMESAWKEWVKTAQGGPTMADLQNLAQQNPDLAANLTSTLGESESVSPNPDRTYAGLGGRRRRIPRTLRK